MCSRPRIVILGGGFGGRGAIETLKTVDADVVVIDKHDYHPFQPMLYQLATDLIAALQPDDVVLGGGNVKKLQAWPAGCRAGANENAFLGGIRLWEMADVRSKATAAKARF